MSESAPEARVMPDARVLPQTKPSPDARGVTQAKAPPESHSEPGLKAPADGRSTTDHRNAVQAPAREPISAVPSGGALAQRRSRPRARLWRNLLFSLGIAVVAGVSLYYYAISGQFISTDNAYLKADKVTLSAQVAGPIVAVMVRENERVAGGQPLFQIDRTPYTVALAKADAQLTVVRARVAGLRASYRQKMQELSVASANASHADREFERQVSLRQSNFISEAALDLHRHDLQQTQRRIEIARQEAQVMLSQLNGSADQPDSRHPLVLEAIAAREAAATDLARTTVLAPFEGVVSKVPQLGQHVSPGAAVLSLAAVDGLWIEANFKETDLTFVTPGQPVEIAVDTYPAERWRGVVDSIAPATGAEYSVLPPQNATGNWVKIVQRIPVKIRLEPDPQRPQLRVGMSSHVTIDTGKRENLLTRIGLQAPPQ